MSQFHGLSPKDIERLERQVFLPLHSVVTLAAVFAAGIKKTLTNEPGSRWVWWM